MVLLDYKRTDAALYLIGLGADTGQTDQSGHTPLDYATAHGLREVVSLLDMPPLATAGAIRLCIRRSITTRERWCAPCWPIRRFSSMP